MGKRRADTVVNRLRRNGARVSSGPWTVCGQRARATKGVLILSLGRAAGPAVARSRIRRIAREVLADRCCPPEALDLLLLVRSEVTERPRRQVRASLEELLDRLSIALTRRALSGRSHE